MTIRATALSALTCATLLAGLTSASAQACRGNFKADGVPMVTGITYRSWDLVRGASPAAVLKNLAAAVAAEGFAGVRVDQATSSVLAIQETTGSGRPQHLRVTARKSGPAVRVDAAFTVQAGQVAPEGYLRDALCRVIAGGRG